MELIIGLDSWIIQDGNYRDFSKGDIREFALEFYSKKLEVVKTPLKISSKIEHIKEDLYRVEATVAYLSDSVLVICWEDKCEYMAFTEGDFSDIFKVGDRVVGEIHLGVDPFFYFESYRYIKGFPKIDYKWEIQSIELETTPWLKKSSREYIRDHRRKSFKSIFKTDANRDFDGDATYLLHCKRLNCE